MLGKKTCDTSNAGISYRASADDGMADDLSLDRGMVPAFVPDIYGDRIRMARLSESPVPNLMTLWTHMECVHKSGILPDTHPRRFECLSGTVSEHLMTFKKL